MIRTLLLTTIGILFGTSFATSPVLAEMMDSAQECISAPLGAPVKTITKTLTEKVSASYRELIRVERDPRRRDELKKELTAKTAEIDGSYSELAAGDTTYDVSILAGEIRKGTGDGLIKRPTDIGDRYWIFADGKLWKVVETFPLTADFGSFALNLSSELGKPSKTEFQGGNSKNPPYRVTWESAKSVIELTDRRTEYGCFTLIVADRGLWKERLSDRVAVGMAGKKIDPLIQDIMSEGNPNDVSDIVDKIIQKKADSPDKPKSP
ncbi:MAG: hypothetical protein HUU55_02495 [Myxococcales bacterium]|nr:hypothetical protein [Myxococcales bacterium]